MRYRIRARGKQLNSSLQYSVGEAASGGNCVHLASNKRRGCRYLNYPDVSGVMNMHSASLSCRTDCIGCRGSVIKGYSALIWNGRKRCCLGLVIVRLPYIYETRGTMFHKLFWNNEANIFSLFCTFLTEFQIISWRHFRKKYKGNINKWFINTRWKICEFSAVLKNIPRSFRVLFYRNHFNNAKVCFFLVL